MAIHYSVTRCLQFEVNSAYFYILKQRVSLPIYVMDIFAQQEGFSVYHRVAGGSRTGTHRRHKGGPHSQSMSPVPFAEDSNGEGGLQGLSPGSAQGTYAAQFRSPCPHSHKSSMGIERSTGSIFDATSPRCGEMGVGGSILSPGVDSVETASSLCMHEEGETAGAWKHDDNKRGENVSWGGREDEKTEDEGDTKTEDWEEGEEEQSDHGRRQFGPLDEDGEWAASAAAEKNARRSSSRQARGPATRYDVQWSQLRRGISRMLSEVLPKRGWLFYVSTLPLRS